MKKKKFLILLGLTVPIITIAQQVVSTSGGEMTNNIIQVNWTIGETLTETTSTNNIALTSGLNQPALKIETLIQNIKSETSISTFPNPTSHFINIKYEGQLPIKAKILSINGNILSTIELEQQTTQLDFSKKVSGVYFIEITDKTGKSNTYKIVKH